MKHWLVIVVMLTLVGCATDGLDSADQPPDVPPELLQRQLDLGIGYIRNRDYTRAKEKLNKALEIDPKNATVHAAFGILFELEGENALAEQYFKNSIKYDPDSAQARNSYGAFLFGQKRYHEAVEQLNRASENRFYPNRSTVFENLGRAYMRINDPVNAEYAFTRAVQLNPNQPRSLLELATIKFDQRNYVESRDLYMRHTQVSPKSAKTLWLCVRLARIFSNQNEEASCAEALEGIFPASPEYQLYKESL